MAGLVLDGATWVARPKIRPVVVALLLAAWMAPTAHAEQPLFSRFASSSAECSSADCGPPLAAALEFVYGQLSGNVGPAGADVGARGLEVVIGARSPALV